MIRAAFWDKYNELCIHGKMARVWRMVSHLETFALNHTIDPHLSLNLCMPASVTVKANMKYTVYTALD